MVGRRPDEPVEVVGPAIDRYLLALKPRWLGNTRFKAGQPFATWPSSICFKVDGLSDAAQLRFQAGLARRVGFVGVEVSDACEGRVYIVITRHADSIIRQVQAHPSLVGYASRFGDIADLSTIHSPIHWVEVGVKRQMRSMIIIVDGSKMDDLGDDTLLDFIAFAVLTAPNNDTHIDGVKSIANVFEGGELASDHWTRLDRAFLKGLYEPRAFSPLTDAELRRRTLAAYAADAPD